jgi:hypothetical protein
MVYQAVTWAVRKIRKSEATKISVVATTSVFAKALSQTTPSMNKPGTTTGDQSKKKVAAKSSPKKAVSKSKH